MGMDVEPRRFIATCLALVVVAFAAVPVQGETSLYRYRNAQGITVIDFSVPARYVNQGYEVLTTKGRVVQVVPPVDPNALTEEAIARREAQAREDEFIIRSYSTLEEIERARQRKLTLVEREIDILEANLEGYVQRRVELRERAAGYQASGQKTPEAIADVLADLDRHEQNNTELLKERRLELVEINDRYDRYATRLVILRPATALSGDAPVGDPETDDPQ